MSTILELTAAMLAGLLVTAELTAIASALMIVLAAIVAVGAIAPAWIVRVIAKGYIDLFRSVPVLVALFLVYFVLGSVLNSWGIDAFYQAALGLAVIESAYLADVYRGALEAVPRGQWEAGRSLGLGWVATLVQVIVPQTLRSALPSTANMIIYALKDSALASMITVQEVTLVATTLVSQTFRPLQIYLILAVLYLLLIIPLTKATEVLERRFAVERRQAPERRATPERETA